MKIGVDWCHILLHKEHTRNPLLFSAKSDVDLIIIISGVDLIKSEGSGSVTLSHQTRSRPKFVLFSAPKMGNLVITLRAS